MYANSTAPAVRCATCTRIARYTWHGHHLCNGCFDEAALWSNPPATEMLTDAELQALTASAEPVIAQAASNELVRRFRAARKETC